MKGIMLVLTQSCNLSCTYCYENHNATHMTWNEIQEIIDYEYSTCYDKDIKVFFFGGEPFLCFEQIKKTVEYIEERYSVFNTYFSITTNGTLVKGEIKDWLLRHRDNFELVLSLDGTAEMHNLNRKKLNGKGSFEDIDLDFFTYNWKNCIAKMTVSENTICNFAEGIIYLESLGFKCKSNFASGLDFDLSHNYHVLCQELSKLITYYSEHPEKPLCFMLDLNLSAIHIALDSDFRYCSAGTKRHCYCDAKQWFPCQGLMPMATGTKEFSTEDFTKSSILEQSPCKSCSFVRICRACYASNYCETGNVYIPSKQTCRINKACIVASARIQYNRLKTKSQDRLTASEKLTIMAIYKISKEITSFEMI